MWLALGAEIALEFSDIRFVPDDGTRFFGFDPVAEVARVQNWRRRNIAKRNATAREAREREPEAAVAATARWRVKNPQKVRAARDRENAKRREKRRLAKK